MPTLLLTTRGRKSGKLRRTALIYGQDGDRYLLVASKRRGAAPPRVVPQPRRAPRRRCTGWPGQVLRPRPHSHRGREAAPMAPDGRDLAAVRRIPGEGRTRSSAGDRRARMVKRYDAPVPAL